MRLRGSSIGIWGFALYRGLGLLRINDTRVVAARMWGPAVGGGRDFLDGEAGCSEALVQLRAASNPGGLEITTPAVSPASSGERMSSGRRGAGRRPGILSSLGQVPSAAYIHRSHANDREHTRAFLRERKVPSRRHGKFTRSPLVAKLEAWGGRGSSRCTWGGDVQPLRTDISCAQDAPERVGERRDMGGNISGMRAAGGRSSR